MLLNTDKLTKAFGGLIAVSALNIEIEPGELVGLIGPNGAGKTTVFNLLTGLTPVTSGAAYFQGKNITGLLAHQVTALGMARTFQNIRLFKELSVLDNVKIACHLHSTYGLGQGFLHFRHFLRGEREIEDKALKILSVFKLDGHKDEISGSLPYGAQRRLEIARALATEPKLLLLDEPAAGMNPQETLELMKTIAWLRDEFKLTILLIEHDMRVVMGICERIYVLDYGQLIAAGTPAEIRSNRRVIEAYLGEEVS
ncbi:MAG: ABC transporter ATP-binding protein [Patescibacteria group bacterium]